MAGRFTLEAMFKAKDRMSGIFGQVETRATRLQRTLGGLGRGLGRNLTGAMGPLRGFGMSLGTVKTGALLAAGAIAGVGLAVFKLGKAGADFEEAITAVGAVSLLTRDQIADLEKKALELGATTKFTATQAANGMELMAKAGFNNAEILQGIGGVLSAAAAEGVELAETAGHVSNVLKGMGLATGEATRVADVLTLASSRTNSSISSLGESMSNVASTARQFQIPLEDTVAAVAVLQDVGLDASVAGSALNTMLTQLANPTDELRKKMKDMGVAFQDAKGNMLPFQEVLANLAKGAEKSGGNMEQVAFFADLVGLRGQKAAANLKDLFASGKFQGLAKELQGAAGSAEKMAKERMNNFLGDVTLLESAIDGVKVALFETQSGPLRGIVQGVTAWVDANKDLIKSGFVQFADKLKSAIAAAEPFVRSFIDGFVEGFGEAWPAIKGALGELGAAFKSVFGGSSGNTVKEFAITLGKVTAAAVGVAATLGGVLVGAALLLGKAWTIQIGLITGAWDLVIGAIGEVILWFDTMSARVRNVFDTLLRLVPGSVKQIVSALIGGLVGGIKSGASWVVDAIKTLGSSAVDAFKSLLGISSPSKVFQGLGEDTGAGFAKGIESSMPTTIAAPTLEPPKMPVIEAASAPRFDDIMSAPPAWTMAPPSVGAVEQFAAKDAPRPRDEERPRSPESIGPEHGAQRELREIKESHSTTKDSAEVTIKAPPGTAKVTKPSKRTPIKLEPSGAPR